MPAAAGVVDEKGSEYILAHTVPRELDGHPLGGCGSGFGLVPGYTTLSVRVRANIKFGALRIKRVRTNEMYKKMCVPAVIGALAVWQQNKKQTSCGGGAATKGEKTGVNVPLTDFQKKEKKRFQKIKSA